MSEESKKDFFNIAAMTAALREWENAFGQKPFTETQQLLLWQTRAQFAIAQQLSVIAGVMKKKNEESSHPG
jgi:hypothetical protein